MYTEKSLARSSSFASLSGIGVFVGCGVKGRLNRRMIHWCLKSSKVGVLG
jgi:hypothetical protein